MKKEKDWKEMHRKNRFHTITYADGRLFCLYACDANGGNPALVWGIDATTGKSLWVAPCGPEGHGTREMFDLHTLKDGTLFTYGHSWARLDAATGKLLGFGGIGGNGRCDTGSATADLITAGFGNYFKLGEDGDLMRTRRDLLRSECGGFTTPGYGMTFGQSSGCGCFQPLRGLMAVHHADPPKPVADSARLTRGPAFERPLAAEAGPDQWPAFLAGDSRYSSVASNAPKQPRPSWSVALGTPLGPDTTGVRLDWRVACFNAGPVTAPVIADGLAVVALRDEHVVVGLDSATGKERWRFLADGRLINPPTLYKGRVIFGTRGGRVFNLDAKTGELAWSFLAAPEQRYLVGYGQLESAWPLHGSLPVQDDIVVAAAGYHGETDGGVFAWGLDARTGGIVWKKEIHREPRPWIQADAKGSGDPEDDQWFNASQSNGRYNVTRVNNMELPAIVDGKANVAMQWLDLKTGEPAEHPVGATIHYKQIYPFFNFRVESRGGPHGTGAWQGTVDGKLIGDHRSGGENTKYAWADGKFYANYSDKKNPSRIFALDPEKAGEKSGRNRWQEVGTPLVEIPTQGAHALIVAADQFVAAGESEEPADICLPVKGWLQVGPQDGEPVRIELDAAPINCGVAVSGGNIFITAQDGSLRCFGGE